MMPFQITPTGAVILVIMAVSFVVIVGIGFWIGFGGTDYSELPSTPVRPSTPRSQSHPTGDEDDDGGYRPTYSSQLDNVGDISLTSSGGLSIGIGNGLGIDPTDGSVTINMGRGFSIDTDGK